MKASFIVVLIAASLSEATAQPPSGTCASLARRALLNVTITTLQEITGGSFTPPGKGSGAANLPPFWLVAGTIAPTPESEIRFEVWMPLANWNGKFAGVGNGGWAGFVSYGALADQLRRGYATASTNTGHEAGPGV